MSYSIGGRELPVIQGDTNQALQAIGQAYGAVNDSYDKLARLPGMAKAMVQDDADARYTAALNKYSNDPNGLAQALANGEIDTSNVRAETLGKTQDTLSNIQKTYSTKYLQNRLENYYNYLDNPENARALEKAQQAAFHGDIKGVNNYIASFNGPAELLESRISKFNPEDTQLKQAELDVARANVGNQGANVRLQAQKYQAELDSIGAMHDYSQIAQRLGADKDPAMYAKINRAIDLGIPIKLADGTSISTAGIKQRLLGSIKGYEFWDTRGGYSSYKTTTPSGANTGTNLGVGSSQKSEDLQALENAVIRG